MIRSVTMLAAIAVMCTVLSGTVAAAAEHPNIILILADDLGWADLACYGNRFNETPSIDRLAKQGVRFTQFYAGPVCSPTRANIQSGQSQARLGITVHIPGHWRPFAKVVEPPVALHMPLEIETYAERLARAGYRTGYFGKWHLGDEGYGPAQQGWQTTIETHGNTVRSRDAKGSDTTRTAELLTDHAVRFIEANKNAPFVLQVSHGAVHIPLSTTPKLLKKYEAKQAVAGYPSRPEYAGLLEELDQSVGRIVETVDRLGLSERTLIVFVSDNGGLYTQQDGTVVTSNAPLREEKGTLYEGGVRVPCIARWTGTIPAAREAEALGSTMDWYATFLAIAGVSPPDAQPMDGVNLLPVLRDSSAKSGRERLFWHLPHYHHSTPAGAMREGDWKLIEQFEDRSLELYNLREDIGETKNVAKQHPDRAAAMHEAMQAWRHEVQAQLPRLNPAYDPQRVDEFWSRKTVEPTGPPGGRKKKMK